MVSIEPLEDSAKDNIKRVNKDPEKALTTQKGVGLAASDSKLAIGMEEKLRKAILTCFNYWGQ